MTPFVYKTTNRDLVYKQSLYCTTKQLITTTTHNFVHTQLNLSPLRKSGDKQNANVIGYRKLDFEAS